MPLTTPLTNMTLANGASTLPLMLASAMVRLVACEKLYRMLEVRLLGTPAKSTFCTWAAVPLMFTSTVAPTGTLITSARAFARSVPETLKMFRPGLLPLSVSVLPLKVVAPFAASVAR